MSLNTSIAAPQTALLSSPQYAAETLVSLFSNAVVLSGTIDSDLSSGTWAQFNFTATSGSWSDVREFQCLLVSSTNDIKKSTFYGRVRAVPTSSIMYSNESSQNFSVGAFFWVIDSWLPQYRLSRPSTNDPLTAVELVDYDVPYQPMLPAVVGIRTGYAGYVSPSTGYLRLGFDLSASFAGESGATIASYAYGIDNKVVVAGAVNQAVLIVDIPYGEQWAAASVTDSAGRVQTRRFGLKVHDPDSYPPDTGFGDGSIDNHLEQGLTFSIPAFTGVDDVLINTCCIVWRNNTNEMYNGTVQSLYGGGSAAVTNKVLSSQTATLTAAGHPFAVGQTVINADCGAGFDGTFIITATTSTTYSFHSAHADVASTPVSGMAVVNPNNVMFVGWLQSEDDPVRSDPIHTVVATANFKFTGVGPRMSRRARQLLALINTASPTRWGDINSLTPWRAILHYLQRYTTVATLCDITFSNTDSQYLFPAISTDGSNMLEVVKGIATQINAVVEFAPDGRIAINRDITYLSTAERTAQVTNVANWTSADVLHEINRSYDPDPDIGYTNAVGAFYNTATAQVVTLTALAPGIALGEGAGSNTLPAQILSAGVDVEATKDELAGRAGGLFKYTNLKEFIEGDHPDGYSAIPFIPSRSQTYTWTIASDEWGDNNVNRYDYDGSELWVVDSASYGFKSDIGRITNRVKYRRVIPPGDPGDDVTQNIPAPDSIPDAQPDLGSYAFDFDLPENYFPDEGYLLTEVNPAFLQNPPGKVATFNGSELLVWNTSQIFYEKNFIALKYPVSVDITPSNLPSGYSIVQCVVDPSFTYSLIPAYCLITNGTDSQVGYCTSIAAPGASGMWTFGDPITGEYSVLRATGTAGSILIYAPNNASSGSTVDLDFLTSNGGFAQFDTGNGLWGQWINTVGWRSEYIPVSGNQQDIYIQKTGIGGVGITTIRIKYSCVQGIGAGSGRFLAVNWSGEGSGYQSFNLNHGAGSFDETYTFNAADVQNIVIGLDETGATPTSYNIITELIYDAVITTGGAEVRYSSDWGETWGTVISLGDSPGSVGGFDVQRSGTNSFGAADGVVARATTLGGAYSTYYSPTGGAQAACIVIPYFTWSGARNTAATNPDIIVGLDRADGSSRTMLWIEGGATAGTVHDLTPVASFIFSNANSITSSYQHHLAVIGSVSGTNKLYTTNNRGSTWVNRGTRTSPTWIRCRRNDTRAATSGTNKGQLFMMDNGNAYYSSVWDSTGPYIRYMPATMIGLETVW